MVTCESSGISRGSGLMSDWISTAMMSSSSRGEEGAETWGEHSLLGDLAVL